MFKKMKIKEYISGSFLILQNSGINFPLIAEDKRREDTFWRELGKWPALYFTETAPLGSRFVFVFSEHGIVDNL